MSYMNKMFRKNILICLVYIVLFSVIMYAFTIKTVRTEFSNSANTILAHNATYIDNSISNSLKVSLAIKTNPFVVNYANETVPDYYNRVLTQRFINTFRSTLSTNTNIICVQHSNDESVLSGTASMSYHTFAEELNIFEQELDRVKAKAEASENSSINYITSDNLLVLVTCDKSFKNVLYTYACIYLDDLITAQLPENSYFVINSSDSVLYKTPGIPDKYVESAMDENAHKGAQIFSRRSKSSDFLGNLTFNYITPGYVFYKTLVPQFILVFVFLALCLLVSYFVAYKITQKNYKPISDLLDALDIRDRSKDIDEFDSIRTKISSIEQDNDELKNRFEMHKSSIEDYYLKNMLYGTLSQDACHDIIAKYGHFLSERKYITVLISYAKPLSPSGQPTNQNIELLNRIVMKLFVKHYAEYAFFRILPIEGNKFAIIASIDDYDEFKNDLRKYILELEESEIKIIASLGSVENGMDRLNKSYANALNVSENRIYGAQYSTVCTPDDVAGFYDKIVTLREFLEVFSKYNIHFAIELKHEGLESEVLKLAEEFGIYGKMTVTSFNFDYLREIKRINPRARIGWLVCGSGEEQIEQLAGINGEEMAPEAGRLTEEAVRRLRAAGLGIRAWGVTDTALMKKMCRLGADGMTVNFPDRLFEYINAVKI